MKLKGKLSVYIVFFFLLFRAQVLSFTGEYEKKKQQLANIMFMQV